ncbi:D-alanyl-D-alanine dipeptidase [Caulifigura coniformis]|uniref:D-alanyl-D-alanine dipeptidase n=1 Tax=Caulifigura coniformis TaxID=2527983 RepID=A0A517SIU4_9PLAN|nr:serine hydrolase [Caulifigura coniformis]QDT56040.1 D-alanyl-D-alanine dipeptidase [Caulifigura coniformis]
MTAFRRMWRSALPVIAIVLLSSSLSAELPPAVQKRIEALIAEEMARRHIPGLSICVATDNEIQFERGFGLADVENGLPVTVETKFRTASIAKSLTAIAAMKLVEEGKLDLDASIQTYLPAFPTKKWPVTSRQLLGHLAGVRHYKSAAESSMSGHFPSVEAGLAVFADDPLIHEPGTAYVYSSFGFNLLGAVMEKASGERFDQLVTRSVFTPAGMKDTCVDSVFAIIPHRTRGYLWANPGRVDSFVEFAGLATGQLYNARLHDTSSKIPGGGFLSTSSDLVRVALALNGDRLLKPESIKEMWTESRTTAGKATQYGLGWRVEQLDGEPLVGHSGGQAGTSTHLLSTPSRKSAVAVMCNLQGVSLKNLTTSILSAVNSASAPPAEKRVTVLPSNTPPAEGYQEIAARLSEFIRSEIQVKNIPAFSISLVDGDRVVWAQGFGTARADGNVPATADSLYRVGSVSKLFTDMAVMQLVEQGKIDLDADVKAVLPTFAVTNPFDGRITLRRVMSHRAGLVREPPVGNYFDPEEPTQLATTESLNRTSLVYAPGTRTKYSNAGIGLAGAVVETVGGRAFEEQIQSALLKPLGMQSSSFLRSRIDPARIAEAFMWSHDGQRFPAPTWDLGTLGAGNLYSSVNDLSRFLIAVLGGGEIEGTRVLSSDLLQQMLTPQDGGSDYGIGFGVGKLDGHDTFGHGGAVYGYATQVKGIASEKVAVAAVASLDCANGFSGRVADYALRLLLARKQGKELPKIETTIPVPPAMAAAFAGRYEKTGEFAELQSREGKLFLREGYRLVELKLLGESLVVDDVSGFGQKVVVDVAEKSLKVGDKIYARADSSLPPAAPPKHWQGLIGEYGWDHNTLYIYEDRGQLYALIEWFYFYPLTEISENEFAFPSEAGLYHGEKLIFTRDAEGRGTKCVAAEVEFLRRPLTGPGETYKVVPLQMVDAIRPAAMKAKPPNEAGDFRTSELTELVKLDPTIQLDIRYASRNNFLDSPFYQQPRAFLQKPAAEALVRAHEAAKKHGVGLLIHDAYRPWFVTYMFREATPFHLRRFVADPAKGSRHNRGCAVDLSLYDLKTGEPIDMVAGYDEFSTRSYPNYPGGTSRQRWYRSLLRDLMEEQGFNVYEFEWWHFDYKDWKQYPIGNQPFEALGM